MMFCRVLEQTFRIQCGFTERERERDELAVIGRWRGWMDRAIDGCREKERDRWIGSWLERYIWMVREMDREGYVVGER